MDVGLALEFAQSVIGDFQYKAAVQEAVGGFETAVALQRALVNVTHTLFSAQNTFMNPLRSVD